MKSGDNYQKKASEDGSWAPTPEWMLNPIPPTIETPAVIEERAPQVSMPTQETQKPSQFTSEPEITQVESSTKKSVVVEIPPVKSNRLDGKRQIEAEHITKPPSKYKHLRSLLGLMFFCLMILGFLTFYFIQEDKWGQQSLRDRIKIKTLEIETDTAEDLDVDLNTDTEATEEMEVSQDNLEQEPLFD